ncbi:MAG: DUF982 domain-containing protein [Mesorhizobium sp.]|uniref:DUF982 domain-containing protein n=1 Tax=Mesorhizobium sp. TaxID=1871066 RepID=UPI001203F704|nr:DUF982 domain-containing protein [Mesorhizobium sp.]TIQ33523.1 MAG: DUF982 domain-containing protein [Mesorhizobium sp.]
MNDVRFPEPVILRFSTASRNVASSFEALECLNQQWPEWARGRSWRAAGRVCRDALDGWRSAHDAHRAFVKAARRAGLIPAKTPSRHHSRPAQVGGAARPGTPLSPWQ